MLALAVAHRDLAATAATCTCGRVVTVQAVAPTCRPANSGHMPPAGVSESLRHRFFCWLRSREHACARSVSLSSRCTAVPQPYQRNTDIRNVTADSS